MMLLLLFSSFIRMLKYPNHSPVVALLNNLCREQNKMTNAFLENIRKGTVFTFCYIFFPDMWVFGEQMCERRGSRQIQEK